MARVRARGEDVRYELLAAARGPRFSIGRGEGRGVGVRAALRVVRGVRTEDGLEPRRELGPGRVGGEPGSRLSALRGRAGTHRALRPPPRPADGVVRASAPLAAAVTTLQVRAFERLRPGPSVQLDLTVNVTPVNRWPPRCLPALLL